MNKGLLDPVDYGVRKKIDVAQNMVMRVYITYALYLLLLPLLLLIHRGEGSFEDEHRLTRDNIARIGQTKLMIMLYSQVSSSPILAFRWLEPRINVDGIQHCRRS